MGLVDFIPSVAINTVRSRAARWSRHAIQWNRSGPIISSRPVRSRGFGYYFHVCDLKLELNFAMFLLQKCVNWKRNTINVIVDQVTRTAQRFASRKRGLMKETSFRISGCLMRSDTLMRWDTDGLVPMQGCWYMYFSWRICHTKWFSPHLIPILTHTHTSYSEILPCIQIPTL